MPTALKPLNLPGRILDAWRIAALNLAKLPRGTARADFTSDELLGKVLRQETKAIIELWETFTQERGNLSRGLLGTARQTVAYLLGFHLVNAARAGLLLRRLNERSDLDAWTKRFVSTTKDARLVWYDLGCGTGAAAHMVSDFFVQAGLPTAALELHLYDGVGTLLDAAATVLEASGVHARTHRVGLERLEMQRFVAPSDAAVRGYSLGYVWNELERNPAARARLIELFHQQVQARTLLLILEPATQAFSRGAMELRDTLVGQGYQPLYPCPAALPCPMLKLSRDWCYSEGEWQQPKAMQTLDKAIGIDRRRLNGTLLAFASPLLAQELRSVTAEAVVVGRPERLGERKGSDYLLCSGKDLRKVGMPPGGEALPRGSVFAD